MTNTISVTYIDDPSSDLPRLILECGDSRIDTPAIRLIEACLASMGLNFEEVLLDAGVNLAYSLYGQNMGFGEPYKRDSDEGEKLEQALTEFNDALMRLREKRLSNLDPTHLNPSARPIGIGTVRSNLTLLPETRDKAKRIGEGNISKGVDICVTAYDENENGK